MFVKIETNEGVVGWGEATLEGKAAAATGPLKVRCSTSWTNLLAIEIT